MKGCTSEKKGNVFDKTGKRGYKKTGKVVQKRQASTNYEGGKKGQAMESKETGKWQEGGIEQHKEGVNGKQEGVKYQRSRQARG